MAVQIVLTAAAFVLGLVCAAGTAFLAYRSARAEVEVANHKIAATTLVHLTSSKDPLAEPKVKAQYDSARKFHSAAVRDAKLAVAIGLGGLAAFLLGAFVGCWTLMLHAGSAGAH